MSESPNSAQATQNRLRSDLDIILGNFARLEDRFDRITSVDEGQVFKSQVELVEKLLERQRSEEENLRLFKIQVHFRLKQYREEIERLRLLAASNPVDSLPPSLEKTVRAVNRILSTPSALVFDVERGSTNLSTQNKDKTIHQTTSYSKNLKDVFPRLQTVAPLPVIVPPALPADRIVDKPSNSPTEESEMNPAHSPNKERKGTLGKFFGKRATSSRPKDDLDGTPATFGNSRRASVGLFSDEKGTRRSFEGFTGKSSSLSQSRTRGIHKLLDSSNYSESDAESESESPTASDEYPIENMDLNELITESTSHEGKAVIMKAMNDKKLSDESIEKLTMLFGKKFEDLVKKHVNSKYDEVKKGKELLKKKKKFLSSLAKGLVEKKLSKSRSKALKEREVEWTCELALEKEMDEDTRRAAVQVLALCSFPDERVPGLRKKILECGLLDTFLHFASLGDINVHREISPADVDDLALIAEGASAKVYKAKYQGKFVALKKFNVDHITFNIEDFRKELALLCMLEHDNLLPCYGASVQANTGDFFILSELMTKGTLTEVVREMKQFMDLEVISKIARDVSRGMTWLHSIHLIHRDLKSLNLLINNDMTAKIIDFGTSRVVNDQKAMTGSLGTPAWIAPEVLTNEAYTEKADVYSFGIVLWELLTAEEPFKEMKTWAIPEAVINGVRPKIPADANPDFVRIMQLCWDKDPQKRPSFAELDVIFTELLQSISVQKEHVGIQH